MQRRLITMVFAMSAGITLPACVPSPTSNDIQMQDVSTDNPSHMDDDRNEITVLGVVNLAIDSIEQRVEKLLVVETGIFRKVPVSSVSLLTGANYLKTDADGTSYIEVSKDLAEFALVPFPEVSADKLQVTLGGNGVQKAIPSFTQRYTHLVFPHYEGFTYGVKTTIQVSEPDLYFRKSTYVDGRTKWDISKTDELTFNTSVSYHTTLRIVATDNEGKPVRNLKIGNFEFSGFYAPTINEVGAGIYEAVGYCEKGRSITTGVKNSQTTVYL